MRIEGLRYRSLVTLVGAGIIWAYPAQASVTFVPCSTCWHEPTCEGAQLWCDRFCEEKPLVGCSGPGPGCEPPFKIITCGDPE